MGALSFVQTYLESQRDVPRYDTSLPEQLAVEDPQPKPDVDPESEDWMSPGVVRALNCTYVEYRKEHYDDCVDDSSEIYKRPGADPDDTSFIPGDAPVLYANLFRTDASDPSEP